MLASPAPVKAIADRYAELSPPPAPGSVPGHNAPPPRAIDVAQLTLDDIGKWLDDHPVVQDVLAAKAGAEWVDSASGALDELEKERDSKVRPLNEQVKTINGEYRPFREGLERLRDELKARLRAFKAAEDARLAAEAEAARIAAAEAAKRAEEAVAAETEARENAAAGEVDAGVAQRMADADAAIAEAARLDREAKRAARNDAIAVKGFGRAINLNEREELTVTDAVKALRAIIKLSGQCPEKIAEAIKSEARAYRKVRKALPDGVVSSKDGEGK